MTTTAERTTPATPDPLGPIGGVRWPRIHAYWCDVKAHRANWKSINEEGYPDPAPPCARHIAADFVPLVMRCPSPTPPTRARQGTWGVGIEQQHFGEYVGDAVIVFSRNDDDVDALRLLPGEARALAAALLRAADVEQFER